jgi:hypothetical protein
MLCVRKGWKAQVLSLLLCSTLASEARAQIALDKAPIAKAAELLLRAAGFKEFVIDPELVASERLVTLRLSFVDRQGAAKALRGLGLAVGDFGGVIVVTEKDKVAQLMPEKRAGGTNDNVVETKENRRERLKQERADAFAWGVQVAVIETDGNSGVAASLFANLDGLIVTAAPGQMQIGRLIGIRLGADTLSGQVDQFVMLKGQGTNRLRAALGASVPIVQGVVDSGLGQTRTDIAYRDIGLTVEIGANFVELDNPVFDGSIETASVAETAGGIGPSFNRRLVPFRATLQCEKMTIVGAFNRDDSTKAKRLLGFSRRKSASTLWIGLKPLCGGLEATPAAAGEDDAEKADGAEVEL